MFGGVLKSNSLDCIDELSSCLRKVIPSEVFSVVVCFPPQIFYKARGPFNGIQKGKGCQTIAAVAVCLIHLRQQKITVWSWARQVCSSEDSVNYLQLSYRPQSIASSFPQSFPWGESTTTPDGRQDLLLYHHLLLQSFGQKPLPCSAPVAQEVIELQNGFDWKGL